jgi:Putative beta-barrel porin-2, OmpL-like. bbp2
MKRLDWDPARWVFAAISALAIVAAGKPVFAQAPPPIDLPQPVSFSQEQPAANPGQPCVQPGGPCVQPGGPCVQPPGGDDQCAGCNIFGCKLGDPWTLTNAIFGKDAPVTIGGWAQFGYSNNSDGVFNTHPHHLDFQQDYLYVEKVADGSKGVGFGGRADILYGTDAQNTQAFGNNPGRWDYLNGWDYGVYGWAMPQLYGEVAWGKVSVKVGHFYTLLGYQVVPATGNFFYSIPFTFNFSEAFTHTGALATYKANDKVTVYAGWTLGWDTGFDRLNGGSSFLGGSSVQVVDGFTVTYILTAGNLGWIGDGYTHSIVADWNINKKWEYVFQSDVVSTTGTGSGGYDTVGINQYLYYAINDCWKVGGRAEWWKADGVSYNECAIGVNWKPIANLRIRPEYRYQWVPGPGDANAFGIPSNQSIFAVDAIITF